MSVALAPWQAAVLSTLEPALSGQRLGHALLLVGADGLGADRLAAALAARILCTAPVEGRACGRCRGCTLHQAGSHPDVIRETLEFNEKTGKTRSEILIGQMRRLGEWFALTPQLGGAQVAVIDPADALNRAAANALLKTLEEPAGNRFLLLVTEAPQRLPATIRSRCQRFELRLPPREAALAWLREQGVAEAEAALDAARGNPGLALRWANEGVLALRRSLAKELQAVAAGSASPVELARAWAQDESLELRLKLAAEYAQVLCGRAVSGAGLTPGMDFQKLSAWFDAANRLRGLLGSPIRIDLAVAGLLRDWREACGAP